MVALDTPDVDVVRKLADKLFGYVGGFKLGLEFFSANGPDAVRSIVDTGFNVFLDLKFHDIPNTVAGAVRAATANLDRAFELGEIDLLTLLAARERMLRARFESLDAHRVYYESVAELELLLGLSLETLR